LHAAFLRPSAKDFEGKVERLNKQQIPAMSKFYKEIEGVNFTDNFIMTVYSCNETMLQLMQH